MSENGSDKGSPQETDKYGSLNFKVDLEFKKAFKCYAVSQGMTMVELLKEGFVLSKKERELP